MEMYVYCSFVNNDILFRRSAQFFSEKIDIYFHVEIDGGKRFSLPSLVSHLSRIVIKSDFVSVAIKFRSA